VDIPTKDKSLPRQTVCDLTESDNLDSDMKHVVTRLFNKVRDQDIEIKGLRGEVIRTRKDIIGKIDTIEQLLHVILKGVKLQATMQC